MENIKYEKKYLKYKNKYKNKRNYLLEKKNKKLTGGSLNGMTIIAIILAIISIIGIGTGISMKKDKIYNYINKNSDLFEKTIDNIKTKEQIQKAIEDQKIAEKNAEEEQLEKEAKEHRRSKVKKITALEEYEIMDKIEEGKKTGKKLWSKFREKAIPFSRLVQELQETRNRRHTFLLEPVYNLESPEQLPLYTPGNRLSDEIAEKQGNPIDELRYLFDNLNKNKDVKKYLASRIKNMKIKDNELHWDILLAHFYWKNNSGEEVIINTYPRFGDPNDIISFKYVNKNWFQLENDIIFEGENYIINITNMKNDYNRIKEKIIEMLGEKALLNLDLVKNIFKKVEEILTNTNKHGKLCYSEESAVKETAIFKKQAYEEKLIKYNETYMELSRLDKLINIPDLHNLSEFNKDLNKYYVIQQKIGKKENLYTEETQYRLFIEKMNRYLIEQEKKEKAKSSLYEKTKSMFV